MRLLLVEDDAALAGAMREHLIAHGHAVDHLDGIGDAMAALAGVDYALVILDLGLPDGSGLDLLRQIRRAGRKVPVIIATAVDQIAQRIEGLNSGADDYLVKPFDLDELAARISSVLRRAAGQPAPQIRIGALIVDIGARSLRLGDAPVELTQREWAVLETLLTRPGATISKSVIEEALYAFGAEIESNAVEVYISRLRKKLGRALISTQRGLGYRLEGDTE
ncbi:response regulator transcription factor [Thioclava sp. BHET1]|nr:response regulator transcription factor [Thioclava sp. BHET1]